MKLDFPYEAPNGLRLNKSYRNPNSAMVRVLKYVNTQPWGSNKAWICASVFGKFLVNKPMYGLPFVVSRGWRCYLFTLMVRNGFLKYEKRKYYITDKGRFVLDTFHNGGQ